MNYAALRYSVGAYLHQDWPEEYGDPWNAEDDFITNDSTMLRPLVSDIRELLARTDDERELQHMILEDFRSSHVPHADDWTYRSWLEEIALRVSGALKEI